MSVALVSSADQAELRAHALADAFPMIEGLAFDELVEDIRQHGVREAIVLLDGQILDGRNRYKAALAAGVSFSTRIYQGDDPTAFVISSNLKRRHLTESQRAMVAAKLANMRHGGSRRGDQSPNLGLELGDKPAAPVTTSAAANLLNVGRGTVEAARKVQREGVPELVKAIEAGEAAGLIEWSAAALNSMMSRNSDAGKALGRNYDIGIRVRVFLTH